MLQSIRDKAQGWIAWAIVILISIPFALWGIQEYLGTGSEPVVASVNGEEITERDLDTRYQRYRSQLREQLGSAFRSELFDEAQMRREVLDSMIRSNLVMQASIDIGLRAGDFLVTETIRSIPAFQRNGAFDHSTYERAVQLQGQTTVGFEQDIRSTLVSNQLATAVTGSALVTGKELATLARLRKQQRDFRYFVIPALEYVADIKIADTELEGFYQANRDRYRVPEQIQVQYLLLDLAVIGSQVKEDEESLVSYYEGQKDQFRAPEQRRASHILITVPSDADQSLEDEARARAAAAFDRIARGEDFSTVAKEVSEDPGSASQGGDLGFFERGIMDPAFEQATFELKTGVVSEPVRSRFGFHLIKVTEVKADINPGFGEVREQVAEKFRKAEAERLFYEYAERLNDLAYEHPDSLLPAAEALGLEVQISDWLSREGGEGIFSNPKVMAAAFHDDVLEQGNNSEAIEIGPESAVILRVAEHREETVRPLSEVKSDVEEALRKEFASKRAAEEGKRLTDMMTGGASLGKLAAGRAIESPGFTGRNNEKIPADLLDAVFRMPRPSQGKGVFQSVLLDDGDVAIVELLDVKDGSLEELDPNEVRQLKASLANTSGRHYFNLLVADIRSQANVEVTLSQQE